MLLRASNIHYSYGRSKCAPEILRGVNFQVAEGEKVGLWGSSGCGKSTLARVLAGHLTPDSGTVTWGNGAGVGADLSGGSGGSGGPGDAELPKTGYCPVQMIYQHPERAINPRWRMRKTMCEAWEPPQDLQRAMGIEPEWLNRFPNELSGGEQQRFCIIRALAPQTRILICDEMSTMLDVITQAQLWDLILRHVQEHGLGLVVITHDDALAKRVCDRIVTMDDATSQR